ncbi:hypothetical protein WAF17_09645 [Bernardetia sp. ABR2-2B]|uniref:hypothetical protein n=1 Tax=Bernardetia sp. ABR2-2B TaxID=3127472 RepID=UPI0030CCD952
MPISIVTANVPITTSPIIKTKTLIETFTPTTVNTICFFPRNSKLTKFFLQRVHENTI